MNGSVIVFDNPYGKEEKANQKDNAGDNETIQRAYVRQKSNNRECDWKNAAPYEAYERNPYSAMNPFHVSNYFRYSFESF